MANQLSSGAVEAQRLAGIVREDLSPEVRRATAALWANYETLDLEIITSFRDLEKDFITTLPAINDYENDLHRLVVELAGDLRTSFYQSLDKPLRLRFAIQNAHDSIRQFLSVPAARLIVMPVEEEASFHVTISPETKDIQHEYSSLLCGEALVLSAESLTEADVESLTDCQERHDHFSSSQAEAYREVLLRSVIALNQAAADAFMSAEAGFVIRSLLGGMQGVIKNISQYKAQKDEQKTRAYASKKVIPLATKDGVRLVRQAANLEKTILAQLSNTALSEVARATLQKTLRELHKTKLSEAAQAKPRATIHEMMPRKKDGNLALRAASKLRTPPASIGKKVASKAITAAKLGQSKAAALGKTLTRQQNGITAFRAAFKKLAMRAPIKTRIIATSPFSKTGQNRKEPPVGNPIGDKRMVPENTSKITLAVKGSRTSVSTRDNIFTLAKAAAGQIANLKTFRPSGTRTTILTLNARERSTSVADAPMSAKTRATIPLATTTNRGTASAHALAQGMRQKTQISESIQSPRLSTAQTPLDGRARVATVNPQTIPATMMPLQTAPLAKAQSGESLARQVGFTASGDKSHVPVPGGVAAIYEKQPDALVAKNSVQKNAASSTPIVAQNLDRSVGPTGALDDTKLKTAEPIKSKSNAPAAPQVKVEQRQEAEFKSDNVASRGDIKTATAEHPADSTPAQPAGTIHGQTEQQQTEAVNTRVEERISDPKSAELVEKSAPVVAEQAPTEKFEEIGGKQEVQEDFKKVEIEIGPTERDATLFVEPITVENAQNIIENRKEFVEAYERITREMDKDGWHSHGGIVHRHGDGAKESSEGRKKSPENGKTPQTTKFSRAGRRSFPQGLTR